MNLAVNLTYAFDINTVSFIITVIKIRIQCKQAI